MPNLFRGEAEIGTGGPVLVCTFNALCEIEAHFGIDIAVALDRVQRGEVSLNDLRAVVAALLRQHHPQVTHKEAGDVIGENFADIRAAIDLAVTRAMPEDDPSKKDRPLPGRGS